MKVNLLVKTIAREQKLLCSRKCFWIQAKCSNFCNWVIFEDVRRADCNVSYTNIIH